MKFEFFRHIFGKVHIKFDQNPSSGGRVVPCGETGMTKLIVAFCLKRFRLNACINGNCGVIVTEQHILQLVKQSDGHQYFG